MSKKLFVLLAFCFSTLAAFSQRFEMVATQEIILESRKVEDNARKFVAIPLPKGTKSYIYRVSIFKKDKGVKMREKDSLSVMLADYSPEDFKMGDTLTNFVTRQTNSEVIDLYVVPSDEDGKAFTQRKMFNSCLRVPNTPNFCSMADTCIKDAAFLCLRNLNVKKDLVVLLEVAAAIYEDVPRWTAERKKIVGEKIKTRVIDFCSLIPEEQRDTFAKVSLKKFMLKYTDAQLLAMSGKESDDAIDAAFMEAEKTMRVRCMSRKKSDDEKKDKKKKKEKKEKKKKEPKEPKETKESKEVIEKKEPKTEEVKAEKKTAEIKQN